MSLNNYIAAASIVTSLVFGACESSANSEGPENASESINKTLCGNIQKPMGVTMSEFDKIVKELKGKSTDEVVKVLGKPKEYSRSNGGKSEYFAYVGVKDDKITNTFSYASGLRFTDHKLEMGEGHHFRDCGQSIKSKGMTIDQFDEIVRRLDGKSKDEVIAVLGKPTEYVVSGYIEVFDYPGVKNPITGQFSSSSFIYFKNNKLDIKLGNEHSFD